MATTTEDMEKEWMVIIRDSIGQTIVTFPFSPNIPLPSIGYIIWMPDRPHKDNGYEVKGVHFGYDTQTVVILTDA